MSTARLVFVWAAVCLYVINAAPTQDVEPRAENYRLPVDIMPTNYKIKLTPYLHENDGQKRFTFDGEVEITIKPEVPVNRIVLHSKTLTYSVRQYWDKDIAIQMNLGEPQHNSVTDIDTYTLSSSLLPSRTYVLHFKYSGKMEDDMLGFYRSSYVDSQNNTVWLGSTQFESYHARRAFPSFDEPKFKATFDLTIVRHVSMDTFANTRLLNTTYNGHYATDVYSTTPPMSTYLLAFMISNFGQRFDGDFGVIARRELYDQTAYSFSVGPKLLKAFDDYFDLKYYEQGVTKMHMAAIPDFDAGAMENWGLLTYRERNLLYQENYTTLSAKQSIAAVIAHEQTHMWFGDLVTCNWWSYTWLNEGFARYFQYFGTAWVEKDMHVDMQFVTDQLQIVMNMDSTNKTNPMSDEDTNTPADLGRMFNSISYNKGGTFIRMVRHIMGEEKFRQSLQEYLKTYKYTATVPQNLFDVWKKYWPSEFVNHADSFFSTYTTQVGYPVLHIEVADDGKSFQVHQKRFLLKDNDGSNSSLLYTVPFTYTTNLKPDFDDTKPKMFLPASSEKVKVGLASSINWIIANIQETGYYRVNYTEKYWHQIHQSLLTANWGGIPELNRAQIVDDLLNMARANAISYDLALGILEYLETETNYLPWTAAFNGLNYLAIRHGEDTTGFGMYIRTLTDKAYKYLGFEQKPTDSALDIYNRAKVLSWSCKYGNPDCISKARDYANKIDSMPVPVNIRSAVYCTVLREGDEKNYDKMVHKFQTETVATEQTLILSSLGCVRKPQLVDKHFWFIVSDSVRRQDKNSALTSLYSENNANVSPVFELVTANFEKLAESLGGYSKVANVISSIAARFTKESQQRDLEKFNKENGSKFGSSQATLNAAEMTVKENLAWDARNMGTVQKFVGSYKKNGAASMNIFTLTSVTVCALVAILLK